MKRDGRHRSRGVFRLLMALVALGVLGATVAVAGASTKFSYSASISDAGFLVVDLEEQGQRRFEGVRYQLNATATVVGTNEAYVLPTSGQTPTPSIPDDRGRISATVATTDDIFPQVGPCGCGPKVVTYDEITLTNLDSGHTYRLTAVTRTFG